MACRNLGKAGLARDFRKPLFMDRIFPAVHQGNRNSFDAICSRGVQRRPCYLFVERRGFGAVDTNAAFDFDDRLVEHRRQRDREIEQPGPRLCTDPQHVAEAPVCDERSASALAFEQRVRRHRCAHPYRMDTSGRDRVSLRDIQHILDSRDCRILVAFGIFAQQFACHEPAIRCHTDQIREGAAAIDPESPGCIIFSHSTVSRALVSKSVDQEAAPIVSIAVVRQAGKHR